MWRYNFNLHFFETLTGIKFILVADVNAKFCRKKLKELYIVYSDYVSKDPFYMVLLFLFQYLYL